MDSTEERRRPIAARQTRWAASIARFLIRVGLKPNEISLLSIVFALGSAFCLVESTQPARGVRIVLLILGAGLIQLRLLCNLFDGMVAVEGGLQSKSGEIYNELPDRISDVAILIAAGYSTSWLGGEAELGWSCAVLAVLTAYVRTLGAQAGTPQQFCGPMAKQQRMFTITAAALFAAGETALRWPARVMPLALGLIAIGCVMTIVRRTLRILRSLK